MAVGNLEDIDRLLTYNSNLGSTVHARERPLRNPMSIRMCVFSLEYLFERFRINPVNFRAQCRLDSKDKRRLL